MDPYFGGGSWSMIASVPTHSNASTPSNQDPYLQQQQQFHQQQQQQQQQQQRLLMQHQQTQHRQSLASHFPLLYLVENLADAIDNGTRDQHVDALINELNNHFEKCHQLLNSVAGSISTQSMTVEEQKQELEEKEKMLNERRDLIDNYPRSSVEDLIKSEL